MNLIHSIACIGEQIEKLDGSTGEARTLTTEPEYSVSQTSATTPQAESPKTGIVQHSAALIPQLVDLLATARNIGIVGMPGIGKTAVARAVFHSAAVTERFDKMVWLTASADAATDRALLQAACNELFPADTAAFHSLSAEAGLLDLTQRVCAQNMRVLLVLDGVWLRPSTCQGAVAALNFATNAQQRVDGSRLIVTTRHHSTLPHSALAKGEIEVVEVPPLTPEHARQLFYQFADNDAQVTENRRVEPQLETGIDCDSEESQDDAEQLLIEACGGNPFALKLSGEALRSSQCDMREQSELREFCTARLEILARGEDPATEACARCVDVLPPMLRECFVDFAAFPQDAVIPEADLLHMLATHAPLHTPHSVAAAARKLDDLVHRSLVSRTSLAGQPAYTTNRLFHGVAVRRAPDYQPRRKFDKGDSSMLGPSQAESDGPKDTRCFTVHESATAESMLVWHGNEFLRACIMSHLELMDKEEPIAIPAAAVQALEYVHLGGNVAGFTGALSAASVALPALRFLCLSGSLGTAGLLEKVLPAALLMHVDVSHCSQLSALPSSIGRCRQLAHLDASHCRNLELLPDSIGGCGNLAFLNVSGCGRLKSLPDEIVSCFQLTHLAASHCRQLQSLPDNIGNCTRLKHLDLSHCEQLVALPSSIGDCSSLARPNILGCERLKSLPVGLSSRFADLLPKTDATNQDEYTLGEIPPVMLREVAGWNVSRSIPWLLAKLQAAGSSGKVCQNGKGRLLLLLQRPALAMAAFVLDQLGDADEYRLDYVRLCDAVADAAYALLHPAACAADAGNPSNELDDLSLDPLYSRLYRALQAHQHANPKVLHVEMPGRASVAAPGEVTEAHRRTRTDLLQEPIHLVQHGDNGELVSDIERQLADTRNIGITGMGGIGKTAVAEAVYRRAAHAHATENPRYDDLVWLAVGTNSEGALLLLQQAFKQLFPDIECLHAYESEDDCLEALTQLVYTSGRRVLLVLDDVWPWPNTCQSAVAALNFATRPELRVAGSRLIVTTRQPCTMSYLPPQAGARPMEELHVIDVPPLKAEHAYELFCHHAFDTGYSNPDPPSFISAESCRKVVAACGGHPQTLVSLAAELRQNRSTPQQWGACIEKELGRKARAEDSASTACARSVDFLPPTLKECFLDLAAFPSTEEQPVPKALLVHLFASHAPLHSPHSIAAAEGALQRLVQHGLLSVRTSEDGDEGYWLHEILRGVAVQRSRDAADRCFLRDEHDARERSKNGLSGVRYFTCTPSSLHEAPAGFGSDVDARPRPAGQAELPSIDLLSTSVHGELRACVIGQATIPAEMTWPSSLRYLSVAAGAMKIGSGAATATSARERPPPLPMLKFLCVQQTARADDLIASVLPATELVHLEVFSCSLTSLPDGVDLCSQLMHLSLQQCDGLTGLLDCMSNCTQLMHLSLSGCRNFEKLPDDIGRCIHLTQLVLSDCHSLRVLPASICECHQLQHLRGCHGLQHLPQNIDFCRQLTYLSIHSKHIEALPETIGGCFQLRQLNLSACTALEVLPESLGCCARLRQMNLSACSALMMLPESIGGCVQLRQLNLSACSALKVLQESLGSCGRLTHLDVTRCAELTKLPQSLQRLRRRRKQRLEVSLAGSGCQDEARPSQDDATASASDSTLSEHWGEEYDVLSDSISESVGGNTMSTLQDSDQSATPIADHAVELGGEATSTRPGSAKSDDRDLCEDLQVGAGVGTETALGATLCSIDPMATVKQVIRAARSLKEATIATGRFENNIDTVLNAVDRLPELCKLGRLCQLFPEAEGAADLNQALLRCSQEICNAVLKACIVMYRFLQAGWFGRQRQAASVEKTVVQTVWQVKGCFDAVNANKSLGSFLSAQQSAEQALHTDTVVAEMRQQLRETAALCSADRARVKAVAGAALARQELKGQVISVSEGSVNALAVSPSGDRFATGSGLGTSTAAVWDAATGTLLHELQGYSVDIVSIAWSPDGSRVATGAHDFTAVVWEAATGTRVCVLRGHSACVRSVAWSPDGTRLATGSADKTVVVWDADTGARMLDVGGHSDCVRAVAWSPDGTRLATGSEDATVAVWDVAKCVRMHELRGHKGPLRCLAWSPDGSRLATGSYPHTVAVWDAATRTRVHELQGHGHEVFSVAWSPDGSKLATALDHDAVIWETATWSRTLKLRHTSWIRTIAWSPDGSLAFTSAGDGTVRIFSLMGRNV